MVDSVTNDQTALQANTGPKKGHTELKTLKTPAEIRAEAKQAQEEAKLKAQEQKEKIQAETKKTEKKAQPQKTNSKCPSQGAKPAQVKPSNDAAAQQAAKPKKLTNKQQFEAAKKEKDALFKELKTSDISPKEAIRQLKALKETFSALDNSFRLEIEKNQKAKDSYKPSKHTDINGNNGKTADLNFYNSNNASTLEHTSYRSKINKEMRSINNKILQQEMRFLRA